jgi:hypothetical protein
MFFVPSFFPFFSFSGFAVKNPARRNRCNQRTIIVHLRPPGVTNNLPDFNRSLPGFNFSRFANGGNPLPSRKIRKTGQNALFYQVLGGSFAKGESMTGSDWYPASREYRIRFANSMNPVFAARAGDWNIPRAYHPVGCRHPVVEGCFGHDGKRGA